MVLSMVEISDHLSEETRCYHSILSSFSGCMDYAIYKSHNLIVSEAVKSKVDLLYETV